MATIRKQKPTRALDCHRCASQKITVSESQQMRRYRGRRRLHADVRCRSCRHRWWSIHPAALAQSWEADRAARLA